MPNLEGMIEPVGYKISDLFLPLKTTKVLPEILRIEDPVVRYYELGINGLLTTANILFYYSIYQLLFS